MQESCKNYARICWFSSMDIVCFGSWRDQTQAIARARLSVLHICDVIKQNESELANNSSQHPLYLIVFNSTKIAISLGPEVQFWWGFHHNIAPNAKPRLQLKIRFSFYSSSDSFCLIASHCSYSDSRKYAGKNLYENGFLKFSSNLVGQENSCYKCLWPLTMFVSKFDINYKLCFSVTYNMWCDQAKWVSLNSKTITTQFFIYIVCFNFKAISHRKPHQKWACSSKDIATLVILKTTKIQRKLITIIGSLKFR